MKVILFTIAFACALIDVGNVHAETTTALLHKYRCYICHEDREPGAGPAFVDVATHYRSKSKAVARLVTLIRKGASSGGPWHMPPHPEVSNAEAAQMARYILSLRAEPEDKTQ
jgi:cytochrome c